MVQPIRDRSVLCETVDSRTHSGFVPVPLARPHTQNQRPSLPRRVAHTSRFFRCVRAATRAPRTSRETSHPQTPRDAHMANTAMYAPPQLPSVEGGTGLVACGGALDCGSKRGKTAKLPYSGWLCQGLRAGSARIDIP